MAIQRKIYRIEEMDRESFATAEPCDDAGSRHAELMEAIAGLRALLMGERGGNSAGIHDEKAFRTTREIAALREDGFAAMTRAAQELDAVVRGSEQATQRILQAAEDIEQNANALTATLKNGHERDMAEDIRDRTTQLFEACNFQDLTGQRIASVASTLNRVQAHLGSLLQIWGDISDLESGARTVRPGGDALLHGPRLAGESGHCSQEEIDAMFDKKPGIKSAA